MDFLEEKQPRARKNHTCDLCGDLIIEGTKYNKCTYADIDTIIHTKSHIWCNMFGHMIYTDELDWESHDTYEFNRMLTEYINDGQADPNLVTKIFEGLLGIIK
jgi:hypothetical protein